MNKTRVWSLLLQNYILCFTLSHLASWKWLLQTTNPRTCTRIPLKTSLFYLKTDLKPGVSEELIEEVHEEVDLQAADAQHHVFLRLGPVAAVVASRFLSLHPQKGQLLKLHSGRHPSHSTVGNRIKLAGIQQGPRWCMKRKWCLVCSVSIWLRRVFWGN